MPRSGKVKVLVPALLLFAAASGRVRALDLDLAAFVERVGSSSTSLRLARLDLSSANADRQSATSLALPRVDLSAGYGRELLEPDPIAPMQLRNQVQASAGVSQTLFNMSVLYALRASSYLDGMTRAQVEAVRQAVINGARKAFYGTLLAREVREVSRESESAAADNYENVKLRFDSGSVSEFELLQAEAAHLASVPVRIRAERDYEVALNALKNLAGLDLDENVELRGSLEAPPGQPLPDDPGTGLEGRPDLQAQEWQRKLLDMNVLAAESQRYPTLAARLQYSTYAFSDRLAWENDYDSLSLGLSLSVPIFSGGAAGAAVRKAEVERDKAATRVEQLRDDIRADLRNARLRLQEASRAVEAASRSAQSAQRAYEIAETRVASGSATQLELKSSRIGRDEARLAYSSAVYELLAARFDWELATGSVP